jgi:hypothetical protein
MNPLKHKIAAVLMEAAQQGFEILDKNSPCAKALEEIDLDKALKEDINRICENVSFVETTKLISLYTRIYIEHGKKRETIKRDLKKIAEDAVKRIENESGRLNIPKQCRSLLLNL